MNNNLIDENKFMRQILEYLIILSFVLVMSVKVAFSYSYINNCTTISSPGYYILASDINNSVYNASSLKCIFITSDNVTLDCDGHTIDLPNVNYFVYASNSNNITIMNCNVYSYGYSAFRFSYCDNVNVTSNNISFNFYAIYIHASDNVRVYNNRLLTYQSFVHYLSILNSSNVRFSLNNLVNGTNIVGGPYLGGNYYGNSGYITFYGYSEFNCTDFNLDWICDTPYYLGHSEVNGIGYDVYDTYPLTRCDVLFNNTVSIYDPFNSYGSIVNYTTNNITFGVDVCYNIGLTNVSLIVTKNGEQNIFTLDASGLYPLYSGDDKCPNYRTFTFDNVYLDDGVYNASVRVCTICGCKDFENYRVFTVDTTPPIITIISPENETYATSTINLNYTVSDNLGIDSCWYSLDGDGNQTLSDCENTTLTLSDGSHVVRVYVSDSVGNEGYDEVYFTVDTIAPIINVQSPVQGAVYNTSTIPLNYTVSDNLGIDSCWYSLDGGANTTLPNCENITLSGLSSGNHYITIYARDISGNINHKTVYFDVVFPLPNVSVIVKEYYENYFDDINVSICLSGIGNDEYDVDVYTFYGYLACDYDIQSCGTSGNYSRYVSSFVMNNNECVEYIIPKDKLFEKSTGIFVNVSNGYDITGAINRTYFYNTTNATKVCNGVIYFPPRMTECNKDGSLSINGYSLASDSFTSPSLCKLYINGELIDTKLISFLTIFYGGYYRHFILYNFGDISMQTFNNGINNVTIIAYNYDGKYCYVSDLINITKFDGHIMNNIARHTNFPFSYDSNSYLVNRLLNGYITHGVRTSMLFHIDNVDKYLFCGTHNFECYAYHDSVYNLTGIIAITTAPSPGEVCFKKLFYNSIDFLTGGGCTYIRFSNSSIYKHCCSGSAGFCPSCSFGFVNIGELLPHCVGICIRNGTTIYDVNGNVKCTNCLYYDTGDFTSCVVRADGVLHCSGSWWCEDQLTWCLNKDFNITSHNVTSVDVTSVIPCFTDVNSYLYCVNPEDESIIHLDTGGKKVIEYNVIADNENRIVTVRVFLENKTVFRYMFNYYRDYLGMVNDGVYVARWLKDYKDDVFPTNFYGFYPIESLMHPSTPHALYYVVGENDNNVLYIDCDSHVNSVYGFIDPKDVLYTQERYILLNNGSLYKINIDIDNQHMTIQNVTYTHLYDDVNAFSGYGNNLCVIFSNGTSMYNGVVLNGSFFDCAVTHYGVCFLYSNGTAMCYDNNLRYKYRFANVSSIIGDGGGVCLTFYNGSSICDGKYNDIEYMCGNSIAIFPQFYDPFTEYCVYDGSSINCWSFSSKAFMKYCYFKSIYVENDTLYLYPGNETNININIRYSSGCVDGINISIEHTSGLIVYVIPNTTNDTVINAVLHVRVPSYIPAGKYDIRIKSRGCGGGTCSDNDFVITVNVLEKEHKMPEIMQLLYSEVFVAMLILGTIGMYVSSVAPEIGYSISALSLVITAIKYPNLMAIMIILLAMLIVYAIRKLLFG